MPILLQDKNRDYRRLRHTPEEKLQLSRAGFQHVLSSNVSAIAESDDDLYIRFHGGATYKYPGQGDLYRPMLQSNSKGKFVWRNLIRKNVSYQRVGSVTFRDDVESRDLMVLSEAPTKKPLIPSLLDKDKLITLGIIAKPNILDTIIATTAMR